MTRLLLVRHGETDWNREGRWQGHVGPGINALGARQAEAAAGRLAGERRVQAVYTSDLERAAETAAVIGRRLGLEPIVDVRLREVDVGAWAGLTRRDVADADPDAYALWTRAANEGYPGGETFEQLERRSIEAVDDIAGAVPDGAAVVVCHGGTIRAVVGAALQLPSSRRGQLATGRNGSISVLETRVWGLVLVAYNEAGHLPDEDLD